MNPINRITREEFLSRSGPPQRSLFRSDGSPNVKRSKKTKASTSEPHDWRGMLEWMDAQLAQPLVGIYARMKRVDPVGKLVVRFALPLDLCPTVNMCRRMPPWRYGQVKEQLFSMMWIQMTHQNVRPYKPIPGFPYARCVCFSQGERDPNCGFEKQALDICQPSRKRRNADTNRLTLVSGLGLIKDDKGTRLNRATWWEPAPKGAAGGVLMEIWTGNEP
jgi:hypothetical protein